MRACAGHASLNAMSQMQARAPGVVGAALDEPRLTAGLICDGYMSIQPCCVLPSALPDAIA